MLILNSIFLSFFLVSSLPSVSPPSLRNSSSSSQPNYGEGLGGRSLENARSNLRAANVIVLSSRREKTLKNLLGKRGRKSWIVIGNGEFAICDAVVFFFFFYCTELGTLLQDLEMHFLSLFGLLSVI